MIYQIKLSHFQPNMARFVLNAPIYRLKQTTDNQCVTLFQEAIVDKPPLPFPVGRQVANYL